MNYLHYFNPTAEMAAQKGNKSYQPPQLLKQFEHDLSCLPILFTESNAEVVYSKQTPSTKLIDLWSEVGFTIPQFNSKLITEQPFELVPWAIAPNLPVIFPPYNEHEGKGIENLSLPEWTDKHRKLFQRESSFQIWDELIKEGFATEEQKPTFCDSISQLKTAIKKHSKSVIKCNFSSSGRGIYFVEQNLSKLEESQLDKVIQFGAIVESQYEKLADFSLHFHIENSSVKYLGLSKMLNAEDGKYQASQIHPTNLINFNINELVEPLVNAYSETLSKTIYSQLHNGYVGVDIMIYSDTDKNIRVHPCVEVNARKTMGLISLRLKKYISPQSKATFSITHCKSGAEKFIIEQTQQKKPVMKNGKIVSGFVPLTAFDSQTKFCAYMDVNL